MKSMSISTPTLKSHRRNLPLCDLGGVAPTRSASSPTLSGSNLTEYNLRTLGSPSIRIWRARASQKQGENEQSESKP